MSDALLGEPGASRMPGGGLVPGDRRIQFPRPLYLGAYIDDKEHQYLPGGFFAWGLTCACCNSRPVPSCCLPRPRPTSPS